MGEIIVAITGASGVATYRGIHVGAGTTTSDQGISVGTGCSIVSESANTLDVYTAASNRIRIDSSGRVIIANNGSGGTADVNADNFVVKNYTNSGSCGISILNADNLNSISKFIDKNFLIKGSYLFY